MKQWKLSFTWCKLKLQYPEYELIYSGLNIQIIKSGYNKWSHMQINAYSYSKIRNVWSILRPHIHTVYIFLECSLSYVYDCTGWILSCDIFSSSLEPVDNTEGVVGGLTE